MAKEKMAISEESKIQEEWYKEAREIDTPDKLHEFAKRLLEDYKHDYGTICHAASALAVAACWTIDGDKEEGGITGFQSSCIMWGFIRHWNSIEGPVRLVQYEDMLYPQYQHKFEKTISQNIFDRLQEKAKKELVDNHLTADRVRLHMESIVNGQVPFGYTIKEDD